MMMLVPVLTPHGVLTLVQSPDFAEEAPALAPERGLRLERAFAGGSGHGLLVLGADEVGTTLPPTLSYWRKFGARYVTALCALPGIGERGKPAVPIPADGELDMMAAAVPPMTGAEYLTTDVLSYVRNGSVLDLQIAKGEVAAMVAGSELYQIKVSIAPVKAARWKSICCDCAGSIDSLVELLQGRLAKGVMERVCREGDGLFPSPGEIKLSCSCPDWADMCKHVAAVLYGVGARLDQMPRLLFVLRGVDENELIAGAGRGVPLSKAAPGAAKVLDDQDVAALFGLEMADAAGPDAPGAPARAQRLKDVKGSKPSIKNKPSIKKKKTPAKPDKLPRASRSKPEPKSTPAVHARKRHDRAA